MSSPRSPSTSLQAVPGRRGRGGGRRANTRATPNIIDVTVVYDAEVRSIKLPDTAPVRKLEEFVAEIFGIPISQQFIYGWPGLEPGSSSVRLRELALSSEPLLYVAKSSDDSNESPLGIDSTETDGNNFSGDAIQGGSSSSAYHETFELNVQDFENDEPYELPFAGSKTVLEVKKSFSELSGIPVEQQEWSGWPNVASDNKKLADCGLDKPFHSLVLMKAQPLPSSTTSVENSTTASAADVSMAADIDDPVPINTTGATSTATSSNTSSAPPLAGVPSLRLKSQASQVCAINPRPAVAKKSCSKAGLLHQIKKRRLETSLPPNGPGPSNRSSNESNDASNTDIRIPLSQPVLSCPNSSNGNRDRGGRISEGPTSDSDPNLAPSTSSSFLCNSPRQKRASSLLRLSDPTMANKTTLSKAFTRLLDYLDPLAQLSLRRVCRETRSWVTQNNITVSEEEKWKKFRLVITETDHKTFESAANMGLPITRFVFEIREENFYESIDLDLENIRNYSSLYVKDLTLRKFFMFQHWKELEMFQLFLRLEKLTISDLVVSDTGDPVPCPSILKTLQVLKLNYEIETPRGNALVRPKSWDLTWGMLQDCISLLYFRFPRTVEQKLNPIENSDGIFTPLMDYIRTREDRGDVALEYLDMKHYNKPDSFYINRFVALLGKCHTRDIKLKNIDCLVVQEVFDEDFAVTDTKLRFCESIVSMINYCPFVENAHLRNLEKISIDVTPSVTDFFSLGKAYKDAFWPKLRVIKIKDSVKKARDGDIWKRWQMVQEDLYGYNGLFDRGSVEYIKIDCPRVPYFLSEGRLADKFKNLKRLEIVSWFIDDRRSVLNKRLTPIWKKLRLEELRIENCPKLSDRCFIGDDEESPDFLRLAPTLKKMTLGLDGTEKITDLSFVNVFSRMKFQNFIILSSQPIKVSERALLKLQARDFGQHIQRFPFDCWSSSLIDPTRFARIGRNFRSLR